jgi:hypothetical protein
MNARPRPLGRNRAFVVSISGPRAAPAGVNASAVAEPSPGGACLPRFRPECGW